MQCEVGEGKGRRREGCGKESGIGNMAYGVRGGKRIGEKMGCIFLSTGFYIKLGRII